MSTGKWNRIVRMVCVLAVGGCSACLGQVIYVDDGAAGVGDGSSWQDAYNYLQDALAVAASAGRPVEIRVAQGVYKPDQGTGITAGDRAASFQLLNGVTLRGGYAGIPAPDPDVRDVKLHETILSGDLGGNDIEVNEPNRYVWPASEPTRADNSFHVVIGSGTDETTVLDGFVITASHKPQSVTGAQYALASGSAMYIDLGSPSVLHCVFRDNYSSNGGAVYSHDSNPAFSHCTFDRNGSAAGGAMYSDNSQIVLENCIFSGNVGGRGGGALLNEWYSGVYLRNCIFTNNESSRGGAICNYADGSAELLNCTFDHNRATGLGEGGAILSETTLTLTGCTFRQNSAAYSGGAVWARFGTLVASGCGFFGNAGALTGMPSAGGAVYVGWGAITTLTDCTFEGNAASSGGAIYANLTYARIMGCRFADNTAVAPARGSFLYAGGGAIAASSSTMRLTGCDFQGNRAFDAGGAMLGKSVTSLVFANCLLAGNRAQRGGGIGMEGISRGLRLNNCTLASNFAGDGFALTGSGILEHCIVWDGSGLMPSSYGMTTASYCDIQGGYSDEGTIDVDPVRPRPERPGQPRIVSHDNIDVDPLFVRPGYWADANDPNLAVRPGHLDAIWVPGDYHLQSQAGHWDRQTQTWMRDGQTSPCIDAGNPAQPFDAEPFPDGGIVNLGAYGGTAEASKSYFGEPVCEVLIPGDINGDCKVDAVDTELASQEWRQFPVPPASQPPTIVITVPADGAVLEVSPSHPSILIVADACDPDGSVMEVQFSIEQKTENHIRSSGTTDRDGSDGWQWQWHFLDATYPHEAGPWTITARAIDDDCEIAFAPEVHITVIIAK